jgi:polysaccharide export outer membrane protein
MIPLFLSACGDPDYSKLSQAPATTFSEAPAASKLSAYKVQIGDVLDIKFYLNPELNETVTVRPDGMISTAVVDNMLVYNQTVTDINEKLKNSYSKELKNPRVTTVIRSFAPIHIYVSGEVNTPSELIVVGQAPTLTQAIARSGGIKNSGDEKQVLIIRRGAGEKAKIFVANYFEATQGGDPTKDVRLAPYDVVFIPKVGAALHYKEFQQNIQQFINPSAAIGWAG